MHERCENCRYWIRAETKNAVVPCYGECRRYPPQIFSYGDLNDIGGASQFPTSNEKDWCGEFKAKENMPTNPEKIDTF